MPAPLQRRRQRLLLAVCAWVLIVAGGVWTGIHLLLGNTSVAWESGACVPTGIAILLALRYQAHGLALLLFLPGRLGLILLLALTVDIPSAAVPRGMHYYLLPLFIAQRFVLQGSRSGLRHALPLVSLLLFGWLHLAGNPLGLVSPMSDAERLGGLLATALVSLLLCALLLHLQRVEIRERAGLPVALARALHARQLQLQLQAQHDAEGRLTGAEALLRWRHPDKGWLEQELLLGVASRHGLLPLLRDWLDRESLTLFRRWQAEPNLDGLRLCLNVRSEQLHEGEAREALFAALERGAPPAGALCLEIEEQALAASSQAVRDFLQRCRQLGVGTALDGFGSGFSALGFLDELPVDELKLAPSFIDALPQDPRARELVSSVLALGQRLGLRVTADGVRTAAQREQLLRLGCTRLQGNLLGPPLPFEEFLGRLSTGPVGAA